MKGLWNVNKLLQGFWNMPIRELLWLNYVASMWEKYKHAKPCDMLKLNSMDGLLKMENIPSTGLITLSYHRVL